MPSPFVIDLASIQEAALRIHSSALKTPAIFCERISKALGSQVYFKAENLQHIGAFKTRGAVNAVNSLDEATAALGVVTHSSGNHGAALARAATLRGIPAHVVMPSNSAKTKIAAVKSYGVEPIFCEPNAESRAAVARKVQEETGATLVHPYDSPAVMAGQGTVGLEILEQVPDVDVIIAPVGGGGLLSGMLVAIKSIKPNVTVIAAEPEFADDAYRSRESGKIEQPTRYDTIADGLRSPLGSNTFPVIKELVDDILLVSEGMIGRAMRDLCEVAHLVVEPSGAVATAALMNCAGRFSGKNVVTILSGGNLDFGNCQVGQVD